jgi:hypothetical protein
MKAIMQKPIVVSLIILCFSILGLNIFLDEYFYRTRPRAAEPAAQRIFPETIHGGTRVYLTRVETLPFDYAWYAFAVVVTIAWLLNQRWRCFGPFTK